MKSRITIDFDFENNQPVIEINYQSSDDVRDKLVNGFLERLGYDSAWFRILSNTSGGAEQCTIKIGAIRPCDLTKEQELMSMLTCIPILT